MPGFDDLLTLSGVERRLRRALAGDLPGSQAHLLMAPRPRPGWRAGELPAGTRPAAGLLLVYTHMNRPHLVLTVRAGLLAKHSGQVSLPGGAVEAGETIAGAAVREAAEEVAVDPARVRVVGSLSPLHIPVSGFTLHPVVAIAETRPDFRHAAAEVARILEVPLEDLLDGARVRRTGRIREGIEYDVPYFDVQGEQVWGATAMVLAEFLWLLGARLDTWGESPGR
jgi:8-oxo-dGTP pyrophosphatase MutT (NUDIX family)